MARFAIFLFRGRVGVPPAVLGILPGTPSGKNRRWPTAGANAAAAHGGLGNEINPASGHPVSVTWGVMFNLVYVSTAVQPFSSEELLKLLYNARARNERSGITGLLLYKQGTFMQALEGEETAVRALYAIISKDLRHQGLLTLLSGPVHDRKFKDWSMGFQNLDGRELGDIPGYDPDPAFPPLDDELAWSSSVAMRLLTGFKQTG